MRADWEHDYVDDIVQQTCTNLFVHWRRASSTENPDSYVNAMLVKVFLSERRRGWAMRVRLTDTLPEIPVTAVDPDDRTMLHKGLAQLPPRQFKLPLPAGAVPSSDGVGAYYLSDDTRTVAGTVAANANYRAAAAWSCQ